MINDKETEIYKNQCKTLGFKEPTIISLKDFYKNEILKEDIFDIPFLIDFNEDKVYMNVSHTGLGYWFDEINKYKSKNEDELLEKYDLISNSMINNEQYLKLFRKYKNQSKKYNEFISFLKSNNIDYIEKDNKQELFKVEETIKKEYEENTKIDKLNDNDNKGNHLVQTEIEKLELKRTMNAYFEFLKVCIEEGFHPYQYPYYRDKYDVVHQSPVNYGDLIGVDTKNFTLTFLNKGIPFIFPANRYMDYVANGSLLLSEYKLEIKPEWFKSSKHFSEDIKRIITFLFENEKKDDSKIKFLKKKFDYIYFQNQYKNEKSNNIELKRNFDDSKIKKLLNRIPNLENPNINLLGKIKGNNFIINLNFLHYLIGYKSNVSKTLMISDLTSNVIEKIKENKEKLNKETTMTGEKYFKDKKFHYEIETYLYTRLLRNILDEISLKKKTSFGHIQVGNLERYIKNIFELLSPNSNLLLLLQEYNNNYDLRIKLELKKDNMIVLNDYLNEHNLNKTVINLKIENNKQSYISNELNFN